MYENNPYFNYGRGGTAPANYYQDPYRQTPVQNNFQQSQRYSIPGRMINNIDEVTPQEVPMDGSVSLFPQNDFSCIYAKTWARDGTIQTMRFVPDVPQQNPQKSPLEERLDHIDQRFDKLEKLLSNKKPYYKPHPKKEVKADE